MEESDQAIEANVEIGTNLRTRTPLFQPFELGERYENNRQRENKNASFITERKLIMVNMTYLQSS